MGRWRNCLAVSLATLLGVQVTAGDEVANSIGMKLVGIPAGRFTMGGGPAAERDEKPAHEVVVSRGFRMGAYEVTNAQYERFDPDHKKRRGELGFSTGDDEAVVLVTWEQAQAFCDWLSQREGVPYRLPTEAEWEYACRAGTTTAFSTGDSLPKALSRGNFPDNTNNWNTPATWYPQRGRQSADLTVGAAGLPNAWGLHDMHGNVEEWCLDWYGPYDAGEQVDPVGRADGEFKVSRGGSHHSQFRFLRSGNRAGAPRDDCSIYIGFRVVQAPLSRTALAPRRVWNYQENVSQKAPVDLTQGPDPDVPYFRGPTAYVGVAEGDREPVYRINHVPTIVACPNGDLLACWNSGDDEDRRNFGQVAARRRLGAGRFDVACGFFNPPDRNAQTATLWREGNTLWHFGGVGAAATYGNIAVALRKSEDNGVTWTPSRMILPTHGRYGGRLSDHMGTNVVLRLAGGTLVYGCDAGGGSVLHQSADDGLTWTEPTDRQIRGIHAQVVALRGPDGQPDGRLMAFGRVGGRGTERLPISITADGRTWTYQDSPWPDLGTNKRCVALRLREGPILVVSFGGFVRFQARKGAEWATWGSKFAVQATDADGRRREIHGAFAALSYDEGKTWEVKRPLVPSCSARTVESMYYRFFEMDETHAEPMGYLAACQGEDGIIHVLSSFNEYEFNLKWLTTPMPAAGSPYVVARADRLLGAAPLTVGFRSDPIETYGKTTVVRRAWDFGDGSASDEAEPTHTYPRPGAYTAGLRVSDSDGRSSLSAVLIRVASPPAGGR